MRKCVWKTTVFSEKLLYDICGVTLSVYPHRASLKNMPGHGGIRTYDLWNTSLKRAVPLVNLSQGNWQGVDPPPNPYISNTEKKTPPPYPYISNTEKNLETFW